MSLREVDVVRQANDAMDYYRALYKTRYGVEPILSQVQFTAGITTMKDLVRKVGYERITKMLSHYLNSDGENGWYKRMGHTLQVFGKNIEQLNAQTGDIAKERRKLELLVRSVCSNAQCAETFLLKVQASDVAKAYGVLCPKCEKAKELEKWF